MEVIPDAVVSREGMAFVVTVALSLLMVEAMSDTGMAPLRANRTRVHMMPSSTDPTMMIHTAQQTQ
jgi:hypothetical protein